VASSILDGAGSVPPGTGIDIASLHRANRAIARTSFTEWAQRHLPIQQQGDTMTEPTVINAADRKPRRYEISVDAVRAGLATYVDTDTQRIFYHTEIDDKFSGRGLANKLIAAALADPRAAGKRIVAICPFVAAYTDKHQDFDDIMDPVTPQAHAVVRAELG
jgi:hypothetical protein